LKADRIGQISAFLAYKIKLRGAGYRLVYQVQDDRVVVFVVAVGRREREEVYLDSMSRLD